jgi:hypothetical protein
VQWQFNLLGRHKVIDTAAPKSYIVLIETQNKVNNMSHDFETALVDIEGATKIVRDGGRKFIRINRVSPQTSVHCLVAVEDGATKALGAYKAGDVFKAASYKIPAKGARGNIFDDKNGIGRMGPYGPEYNR